MLPTGRESRLGTAPSLLSYDWMTRRYIAPSDGPTSARTSARRVFAASPSVVAARSASQDPAVAVRAPREDFLGFGAGVIVRAGFNAINVPASAQHFRDVYARGVLWVSRGPTPDLQPLFRSPGAGSTAPCRATSSRQARTGVSAHRQCVARLTRHTTQPSHLERVWRPCDEEAHGPARCCGRAHPWPAYDLSRRRPSPRLTGSTPQFDIRAVIAS